MIPLELPHRIFVDENEQMLQICQQVTSLATLLAFENYFQYFARKTNRFSEAFKNMYEKIFAHPSYNPILAESLTFMHLLNEVKLRMPNSIEFEAIEKIERKHYQRFWTIRRQRSKAFGAGILENGISENGILENAYFFYVQVERSKGLPNAFEIVYDAVPFVKFSPNICLYRPKQKIMLIGNCLEIGEPEKFSKPQNFSFQQQMNSNFIPNCTKPWYLFINEANIQAYEELLTYSILFQMYTRVR